jgi:hypothetical protein
LAAEPLIPLPFSTDTVTFEGRKACLRRLMPSVTSRAFSGAWTSGWTKLCTAAAIALGGAVSSA